MNYMNKIREFKTRADKGEANKDFLIEMEKIDNEIRTSYFSYELSDIEYICYIKKLNNIINKVCTACIID